MTALNLFNKPTGALQKPKRTMWSDARRSFSRNRLAMGGLAVVLIFIICAIFANFLAPTPYDFANLACYLLRCLL